ncbi:MAG TPA: hypothetical protein VMV77_03785 [Bacteroidales bacterium]|nr:hypothetical protein [Bacteroidales bacterium]
MRELIINIKDLETLVSNIEQQSKKLPSLKRMLESSKLEIDVFSKFPGSHSFYDPNKGLTNQGLQLMFDKSGPITPISNYFDPSIYASVASGMTGSFYAVSGFSPSNDNEAIWKTEAMKIYTKNIDNNSTLNRIKSFYISIGFSKGLKELEEFIELKEKYTSGIVDHTAYTTKARNLLQHIKGIMKMTAQIERDEIPSYDKELSWPKIGIEIITKPKSSVMKRSFKELGDKWVKLYSSLSTEVKDYENLDTEEILYFGTKTISLIDAFIAHLDEDKIKNAI